ncbi:hypothetical protein SAY87_018659 [Trapa incisa]|uniref:DNA/RNA helicase protein n=1 Tax=Trapa incisa TaxID=236973 RepID=A0AAN7K4G3_9MYRT|nr:hypothetical protein SAY87_018659 [Trapa incisa]
MGDPDQLSEADYALARQLQALSSGASGSQDGFADEYSPDDDSPSSPSSQSSPSDSSWSEPHLMGFVLTEIIGSRFYSGTVNVDESVALVRHSFNQYSKNAIKVLNTQNVKLGHLNGWVANTLSPLMDSGMIIVDGIVTNYHKIETGFLFTCQLRIFARDEVAETVKEAISQRGLLLRPATGVSSMPPVTAVVKKVNKKRRRKSKREKRTVDEIFDLVDKNVREKAKMETLSLEPPKEVIKTELMDHQKVGLGWLVHRENSEDLPPFWEEKDGDYVNVLTNLVTKERPKPLRGGIFADDMGLGKTLTLLSLIALDKFGTSSVSSTVDEGQNFEETPPVPTPSSRKKTKRGRRVPEGHTPSFTGNTADPKHKMTLVVCPPSVFVTWMDQLKEHTVPEKLRVYTYYGTERTRSLQELSGYDIVLTTFNTLASEQARQDEYPVKNNEWWRIILDEAHTIKNAKAKQSLAVSCLRAKRRWAVTGTPIQNGALELFSLMTFLHFEPFSVRSYWQRLIQRPLNKGKMAGITRLQILMATISLRRTKDRALAGLPKKTVETCLIDLGREERCLYNQMEADAQNFVRRCIQAGTLTQSYTTVLSILLRLRQICISVALCPPDLQSILPVETMEDVSKNPELLKKLVVILQDGEDLDCPICMSTLTDIVITRCAHVFCRSCINKVTECSSVCPLCRRPISDVDLFYAPPESLMNEQQATLPSGTTSGPAVAQSSKVSRLIELLKDSRDQNPMTKSVIYSQFRKMLILLEEPLMEAGFKALRLDGTMNARKRAEVIQEFGKSESGGPTVLLASIRSSGAGINLTAASVVYLLDPWWNPAVEAQAMDRVYRIGQDKNVRIVRMIVRNSIEEKVLELQETKKRLVKDAFVGKSGAKSRREVAEQDIRTLVSLDN